MRAVMYHYVREFNPALPNFRFLDVKNFRKQLDFFDQQYGFVSPEEWRSFVASGQMPMVDGKVVLTFDDAMSCHYDYVFPELIKRNLWAIFYVPTLPYIHSVILDVHRIHLLCGAFDGLDLMGVARKIVTEDMIPFEKHEEFRSQTYTRQLNYEGVSEFKRLLNYFISYDFRSSVIDEIAKQFSYEFMASQFYTPKFKFDEMKRHGMIVGSHTNSHPVMSKLLSAEQEDELTVSFDYLDGLLTTGQKTYCHPYGGFHSFNDDTVNLLNKHGVAYSFNVEARQIQWSDWKNSRQYLPRYDCNLFPHGEVS